MKSYSLEDNAEDIVGKAMRGLGISNEALAQAAGVGVEELRSLREGRFDAGVAEKIAPHLNLHGPSLLAIGQGRWRPEPVGVDGLFCFTSAAGGGMLVNAYFVFDRASRAAVIFDTGEEITEMLAAIDTREAAVAAICITHCHHDHVACLRTLQMKFPTATLRASKREPLPGAVLMGGGDSFSVGSLRISVRETWGHSPGGLTYVVEGLARPVAVVGDAIFAGSMGGGMVSYADALRTNREGILTLPDETILCPGHGPLTTVGEEKRHNPFLHESLA